MLPRQSLVSESRSVLFEYPEEGSVKTKGSGSELEKRSRLYSWYVKLNIRDLFLQPCPNTFLNTSLLGMDSSCVSFGFCSSCEEWTNQWSLTIYCFNRLFNWSCHFYPQLHPHFRNYLLLLFLEPFVDSEELICFFL